MGIRWKKDARNLIPGWCFSDTVELAELLIEHGKIGVDQVSYAEIVNQQLLKEGMCLTDHAILHIQNELGIQLHVG